MAVPRGATGDDAETGACARGNWLWGADDDAWVDLVGGAVAIDRGARRAGNHRADPVSQSAPSQPVDQRILKRLERRHSADRVAHQPARISAARMGNRQQYWQRAARRDDFWGKERAQIHGVSLTVPEKDSNICNEGAAGKSRALQP